MGRKSKAQKTFTVILEDEIIIEDRDILSSSENLKQTKIGPKYQTEIPPFILNSRSTLIIYKIKNYLKIGLHIKHQTELKWDPTKVAFFQCKIYFWNFNII